MKTVALFFSLIITFFVMPAHFIFSKLSRCCLRILAWAVALNRFE